MRAFVLLRVVIIIIRMCTKVCMCMYIYIGHTWECVCMCVCMCVHMHALICDVLSSWYYIDLSHSDNMHMQWIRLDKISPLLLFNNKMLHRKKAVSSLLGLFVTSSRTRCSEIWDAWSCYRCFQIWSDTYYFTRPTIGHMTRLCNLRSLSNYTGNYYINFVPVESNPNIKWPVFS